MIRFKKTLLHVLVWLLAVCPALLGQDSKPGRKWVKTQDGCLIFDPNPVENQSVNWTGDCKEGYTSGGGEVTWYVDGKVRVKYTGQMLKGKRHGQGKILVFNFEGEVYQELEGSFENGLLEGEAIEIWWNRENGSDTSFFFKAPFVNGIVQGQGYQKSWLNPEYDVVISKGEFYSYDLEGEGEKLEILDGKVHKFQKGSFPWVDFTGEGEYIIKNNHFIGGFKNGRYDGKGKLLFKDKLVYEGDWKNGDFHGLGKRVMLDGSVYYGDFKNNSPAGFGVLVWKHDTYFIGEFVQGLYNGMGYRIVQGKPQMAGIWDNGSLNKERKPSDIQERLQKRYGDKVSEYLAIAREEIR